MFTCGKTNPSAIAEKLHERLTAAVPGLRMIRGMTLDRFLHLDMEGGGEEGREGGEEGREGGKLVLDRWMAVEDETSYYSNEDKHRWGRQGEGRVVREGEEGVQEEEGEERNVREGEEEEEEEGVGR